MIAILSALAAGFVFGLGLVVSQMIDPAKVLAFLDIFGAWDPSLAFVMGGAVIAYAVGDRLVRRRSESLIGAPLDAPGRVTLDARLIGGSAIFGLGWGLVGLCPGPALTILPLGLWKGALFVAAMLAGMGLYALLPADWSPARRGRAEEIDA